MTKLTRRAYRPARAHGSNLGTLARITAAALTVVTVATSQAAQLVGPIINASATIRAISGFQNAIFIGGACRESQGAYWTCARNNGTWFAIRLAANGVVTANVNTGVSGGSFSPDMTYDRQRQNVWIAWPGSQAATKVVSAQSLSVVASPPTLSTHGLAWDGQDRVFVGGHAQQYDAATFSLIAGPHIADSNRSLAYLPTTGNFWASYGAAAGGNVEHRVLHVEHDSNLALTGLIGSIPPETSFLTDASLPNPAGSTRGGFANGMDAWQDPITGEWLGVFCQRTKDASGTQGARMYTARFAEPTGGHCGGPRFENGPQVVQDRLDATGLDFGVFAWLMVATSHQSFTAPIFAPGCTIEVDPAFTTFLGTYQPNGVGRITVSEPVPVIPALQEVPLYYQWITLDQGGNLRLSQGVSAAIKQW